MHDEYGLALGLIEKGELTKDKDFATTTSVGAELQQAEDARKDNAVAGRWGLPAN